MQVIGIVAEYNPFHTGHAYQIEASRRLIGEDTAVVVVMSGNWVQQADCAIAQKHLRAKLALMGGADLILELPTIWATSSAEGFARGAAELFDATGVIDYISFGSECGTTEPLSRIAACLDSNDCQRIVADLAGSGLPFPVCRQKAVEQLLGAEAASPLSRPNNNLGIEYIRALNQLGSKIHPISIPRRGSAHNRIVFFQDARGLSLPSDSVWPEFVSATQIRQDLMSGNWSRIERYLLPDARSLLEKNETGFPSLAWAERAILAKLRTMTAQDWALLPDSGENEGLIQRLERAGQQCVSVEEFYRLVKTKRFTHARLRRLVLRAYLGIAARDTQSHPSYIRVLGFNRRGQSLLREMKDHARLPVLTKPAHARQLPEDSRRFFTEEARYTDLYDLCFERIPAPGREWRTGPVILEEP